jgi:hypothetical protein
LLLVSPSTATTSIRRCLRRLPLPPSPAQKPRRRRRLVVQMVVLLNYPVLCVVLVGNWLLSAGCGHKRQRQRPPPYVWRGLRGRWAVQPKERPPKKTKRQITTKPALWSTASRNYLAPEAESRLRLQCFCA